MEDLSAKGYTKVLLADYGLPNCYGIEFGWKKDMQLLVTRNDGSDGTESFLRLTRYAMPESYEAIKAKAKKDENFELLSLMYQIENES